jgi:copper chaperone
MAGVTLRVDGMTCGTCEDSIQRALSRVPGVRQVRANHRTGLVEVEVAADVDGPALRLAVEDAGYDLVEGSAPARP